jgi:uncharacterized membrane protein YjgN (DUF898 family)
MIDGPPAQLPPLTPPFASSPTSSGEKISITYDGSPWSLAGLGLLNFFLTIITLGIYSFWGRTEVRRRIWSSVRINGEPLEYTGRGKELFIGFIVVFGFIVLPFLLAAVAVQILAGPEYGVLIVIPIYILFPFLFGLAVYRTRRYRMSRTRWRGIRGSVVGSPASYAWGHYWTMILSLFAAGFLTPWRTNYLYRRLTNDMRFGDQPFAYKGKAGPLYPPFALAWIGGLVSIGLYGGLIAWYTMSNQERFSVDVEAGVPFELTTFETLANIGIVLLLLFLFALFSGWYNARSLNHFTNNTRFQGLNFKLEVWGLGLVWLFISNQLLSLFTLGILKPVAEARAARYIVDRMTTEGMLDVAAIAQSQAALDKSGEGLAEAFDIDAFG